MADDMTGWLAIEPRAARVAGVSVRERIISVLAVPYDSPARVEYRGQLWSETFDRGAFAGLDAGARRIPVTVVLQSNSDGSHTGGQLVGRVASANPEHTGGLALDLKIANTDRGTETLELANDDMLSPSIGFAIRPQDEQLDRRTMTRRIRRAALDHLSLVPQPAYAGARVLGVRAAQSDPAQRSRLETFLSDPVITWANERRNTKG